MYLIRVTHIAASHFEEFYHSVETVVPIQYPGVLGWWKINCHLPPKKPSPRPELKDMEIIQAGYQEHGHP